MSDRMSLHAETFRERAHRIAPALARMIAGMREEWGIVAIHLGRHEVEEWGFDTRKDALDEASALDLDEMRIVRRYVTDWEEA